MFAAPRKGDRPGFAPAPTPRAKTRRAILRWRWADDRRARSRGRRARARPSWRPWTARGSGPWRARRLPRRRPQPPPRRPPRPRAPDRQGLGRDRGGERARARHLAAREVAPGPAGTGILDKALGADAMLLFGVDGAVPEVVNGRVAMFGFVTALVNELRHRQELHHPARLQPRSTGASFTIIALVIAGTLAPCVMADPKRNPLPGRAHRQVPPRAAREGWPPVPLRPAAADREGLPDETPADASRFGTARRDVERSRRHGRSRLHVPHRRRHAPRHLPRLTR